MEKSTFTSEYAAFVRALRDARKSSGVTQVELAERMGTTQSIVSKWERGELRLDIIQLRQFCLAIGLTLKSFVTDFEEQLVKSPRRRR